MMIVYGLLDTRTNRVRYIGKSTNGLLRPLSHGQYGHSPALAAWLRDLKECHVEYSVVILAEAFTEDQLSMFEAHWIAVADRFGWPIVNKARPKDALGDAGPSPKRWTARAWRNDPDVKAQLQRARENRGAWKKK